MEPLHEIKMVGINLLNMTDVKLKDSTIPIKPMYLKIILTSGLFVITTIISLLPLKCIALARRGSMRRKRRFQKAISLSSCFAGGVFLGACFLDLLPDVQETLSGALKDLGVETEFPVPEFIMIYGLFIVLVTEQLVMTYQERGLGPSIGHGHSHGGPRIVPADVPENVPEHPDPYETINERGSLLPPRRESQGYGTYTSTREKTISTQHEDSGSVDYSHSHAHHHHNGSSNDNHHHHRHHHNEQLSDQHSALRAFLLMMALSLHSLFEGLALGLLKSNETIVNVFAALVLHKLVMGFSLGLNLVQSNLSLCSIIGSIMFFSVTSPLGASVGIVFADQYHTPLAGFIAGSFQAVACGTFLYVTFFEVLPHEMNAGGDRILKVLSIILGFSLIAVMISLLPEAPDE